MIDNRPKFLTTIFEDELLHLECPAQYIGGEVNSVIKNPSSALVQVLLAFPDTYAVGMSNIGLQILYSLINEDKRFLAERSYLPLTDMEELLKSRNSSLFSLETKRPWCDFDIVGFTLQHELCATNILSMLTLAKIPLRNVQRSSIHPIILGGGAFATHATSIMPFFDAFFIGEAEDYFIKVLETVSSINSKQEQRSKDWRDLQLRKLSKLDGVYIPTLAPTTVSVPDNALHTITKHTPSTLENHPPLTKPVIPFPSVVHERLPVEIMRGCVRGCRFCQAGFLYRPQRERSPELILNTISEALHNTGYEELAFLSLSSADYSCITPLLGEVMDLCIDRLSVAVSFPSTRVDALNASILDQVKRIRRSGFTVAPEAGSQRLRDVINKGLNEQDILNCCDTVYSAGWDSIKLYFMIGLPTETQSDIDEIVDLVKKIRKLPSAKSKGLTVSTSTFVPKPHTPFQWAAQISPEQTNTIQQSLKHTFRSMGVKYRYGDAFASMLECVFARGGNEIADVIETAWTLGCRMDAWSDHLRKNLWDKAFEHHNIMPSDYGRPIKRDATLLWDYCSTGVNKRFLETELDRALEGSLTKSCLNATCSACGACDKLPKRNITWKDSCSIVHTTPNAILQNSIHTAPPSSRLRLKYTKTGLLRFLGHLDLSRVFHRAVRRARIPVCVSEGFHPLPKIIFGPPLQLGIESHAEYLDLLLNIEYEPNDNKLNATIDRLNHELPMGLKVIEYQIVKTKADSLFQSIEAHTFNVFSFYPLEGLWFSGKCPPAIPDSTPNSIPNSIPNYMDTLQWCQSLTVTRKKTKKPRGKSKKKPKILEYVFTLKDSIKSLEFFPDPADILFVMSFQLQFTPERAAPKPSEITSTILGNLTTNYHIVKSNTLLRKVL